jgi:hypothetical protein
MGGLILAKKHTILNGYPTVPFFRFNIYFYLLATQQLKIKIATQYGQFFYVYIEHNMIIYYIFIYFNHL